MLILAVIATFLAAGFLGEWVTHVLVRGGGWWAQRLSGDFVRANIPVGGVLVALTALVVPAAAIPFVVAVALGFTLAALGYEA